MYAVSISRYPYDLCINKCLPALNVGKDSDHLPLIAPGKNVGQPFSNRTLSLSLHNPNNNLSLLMLCYAKPLFLSLSSLIAGKLSPIIDIINVYHNNANNDSVAVDAPILIIFHYHSLFYPLKVHNESALPFYNDSTGHMRITPF